MPLPDGALPELTHQLAVSRYAEQLDAYRSAFPEIPVITVAFERLKSDPTTIIREIFMRLEIDPNVNLRELPPLNARPKEDAETAFRLTEAQRSDVVEALRADVRRLHDAYGFDVSIWGLI